ncbi:hypothetical protein THIX_10620 [Thiomonas sp. X19]|nr:hypothetical protein THIX_10620 [Thiomonas sp. X19]
MGGPNAEDGAARSNPADLSPRAHWGHAP